MSWLKNLLLTILGFLRIKGNQAVDLRYAGAELKAQNKQKIAAIKEQINSIDAQGILLEDEIKKQQALVKKYADAVRHHNAEGNEALKQQAYDKYTEAQQNLDTAQANEVDIRQQSTDLKRELRELEQDSFEADNSLNKAANRQVVGRAKSSIENMHQDLKEGSLAEAIEQSDLDGAKAEAKRRERKANDSSEVLAYQKTTNVRSMDDLLAESK